MGPMGPEAGYMALIPAHEVHLEAGLREEGSEDCPERTGAVYADLHVVTPFAYWIPRKHSMGRMGAGTTGTPLPAAQSSSPTLPTGAMYRANSSLPSMPRKAFILDWL